MLKDFNTSIWHAFWVLLPASIAVFLVAFFSLEKGCWYFFDPKHNLDERLRKEQGTFEPHSARYQDLSKLLITLSGAAIAFLIGVLASDKSSATVFTKKIEANAPIVVGFFSTSIALLALFMIFQTIWYEQYCHSTEHSSYKRWKYALSMSLGWTGLVAFVLGFGWLARNLFS